MSKFERKKLLGELIEAIQSGNKDQINKLKYDNLFYGSNLLDVVINYIFLSHVGINFDFGHQTLKKGTKLYRIRRFEENVDFSNPSQWSYPPKMPMNRANNSGEQALYLGTTENVCLIETHIKNGEQYYLGEYEVNEDIDLGGFLDCEDYCKASWYLAGVILNAFLIAPARGDINKDLYDYLDDYYKNIAPDDLQISEVRKMDLPLKFGVINKKKDLYKITNRLIEDIKKQHPEGLSYSSCFIPVPTIGIICSDYNIVLYRDGIKKIRFIRSILKTNDKSYSGLDILKILVAKQT